MRKNPITMVGRIDRCWLFAYRAPVSVVRAMLPPQLEPITRGGFAFFNIVVCQLSRMRPRGVPGFLGVGYRHAAVRIYAKCIAARGDVIKGLYFIRSDADSALMTRLGNVLTDYRFHHSRITINDAAQQCELAISSDTARGGAVLDREVPAALATDSAFASLDEAAAFLKYEPAGLSVNHNGKVSVVRITRDELRWRSRLLRVAHASWSYLENCEASLEVCYEIDAVDYRWNRAVEIEPAGAGEAR